jgi:hypothetical protein
MDSSEINSLSLLMFNAWTEHRDFVDKHCAVPSCRHMKIVESLRAEKCKAKRLACRRPKESALDRMLRSNENYSICILMEYQKDQMFLQK